MSTPRIYRKKPIEIEAVQVCDFLGHIRSRRDCLPRWLLEAYDSEKLVVGRDCVTIPTLEGSMVGGWFDWIICGAQGELYPCKDEIFKQTYDQVG